MTPPGTPVASAGPAQAVASGAAVTLDGSGSSDPNKLALTYAWTQTAGPAVTLSSATAVKPTFTAPTDPAALTFYADGVQRHRDERARHGHDHGRRPGGHADQRGVIGDGDRVVPEHLDRSAGEFGHRRHHQRLPREHHRGVGDGGRGSRQLAEAHLARELHDQRRRALRPSEHRRPGHVGHPDVLRRHGGELGSLPNNGATGLTVTPAVPKATTSLLMTVTGVSSTTVNVGLSEIQAFGTATVTPPGTPVASAGPAQAVASGAAVTLDGSGSSDPNKLALTYAWTQTAGPAVTLSSATAVKPTFTAPTDPAALTFSLTVSNGTETSAPATVTITVAAPAGTLTNVASLATATASSQNTSTGQLASSAIDGIISGYPANTTAEWATVGGGVGSWLKLDLARELHDQRRRALRPSEHRRPGHVGHPDVLRRHGGELRLAAQQRRDRADRDSAVPKATTSLLMTVTGVSSTTVNVGLSEIQAFGTATVTPPGTPVASAGPAQAVASGAAVTLDGSGSPTRTSCALTYAWTQTAGPAVTLSSATAVKPTFTAPTDPAALTFSLTVSNGTETSAPATVTITVAAPAGTLTNVASLATATASSQNTSTGTAGEFGHRRHHQRLPREHHRGVGDGGRGVGSWLKLTWPAATRSATSCSSTVRTPTTRSRRAP